MRGTVLACLLVIAALASTACRTTPTEPGRIHGVLLLSDQIENLTSIEAIQTHVDRLASDREKADRLFNMAVKFRHQSTPPKEFLEGNHVHDPVKIFNVYGYCQCCCASAILMALGRQAGLEARGRNITRHSVPELFYDDRWHMYDASLINYFVNDQGHVASVDELAAGGADLISHEHSEFIDEEGLFPAGTHRLEVESFIARENGQYEWPYSVGHRVGQSLRSGESLVRNWSNKGLFLDKEEEPPYPPPLDVIGPSRTQVYLKDFFPGYAMGLVGNGEYVYRPDFATGGYRDGILSQVNIVATTSDSRTPTLRLASAGYGEIIMPFSNGYVFLGGEIRGRFVRGSQQDSIRALISLNNGLEWEPIWSARGIGEQDFMIDLKPHIYRRYRYLLKIALQGSSASGISSLSVHHDIQHSQRALPLLRRGTNRITVTAERPGIATRTLEGSLGGSGIHNASYRDFHPEIVNFEEINPDIRRRAGKGIKLSSRSGSLTFPVETPGPIDAVRFGGSFRCRDPNGRIDLQVSDDDGGSWKEVESFEGPFLGLTRYVSFTGIKKGSHKLLVRYQASGTHQVGIAIFVFRIDVDYQDPRGGIRPVKVTYEWSEGDVPRSHSRIIDRFPTTYPIVVDGEPLMRSVRLEGL